ncbi:hypothetical protein SDRG_07086 [Saprolegnia diclina VS20]|uniref:PH domain-containing protein n=1 Tax=Saprolegnia diclina (strain VS20) TaxID=1156394 RepID=T0QBU8_SAPDV|nr:hypothetical protein SDRG_07086 [Saprolegnia diclina VS20]EQC35374.1 hypothetical protein SDRG_07086 [Saprolegnia diclina VS20]|eukprot:XP_008611124.1 hypothetical protein SDRG_07086 [Saprolegnia diclina VS20]
MAASEACATIGSLPSYNEAPAASVDTPAVAVTTRWEGYLQKRSDWLKQWEAYYFVLHGCALYCYLSADEAKRQPENSKIKHGAFSFTSHVILQHVVSIHGHGAFDFIFETSSGKPVFLRAKTQAMKTLWMAMAAQGIHDTRIDSRGRVGLVDTTIRPATLDDAYAALAYVQSSLSALEDEAREKVLELKVAPRQIVRPPTLIALAVAAPSIDRPVMRLVSMCHRSLALRTNYRVVVPFQGAYSGHHGLLEFLTKLTKAAKLLTFAVHSLEVVESSSKQIVVVAKGHESMQVRATGKVLRQDFVHKLYMLPNDGRILRWEVHGDTDASALAFKGLGSSGQHPIQRDSLSTIKLDHLPSFETRPSWQPPHDALSPDDVAHMPTPQARPSTTRRSPPPRRRSPPPAPVRLCSPTAGNMPPSPHHVPPSLHYVPPSPLRGSEAGPTITSNSPLEVPLNFKRGHAWPDPPSLLHDHDRRAAIATELDLCRRRDDLDLYATLACKSLRCAMGTVCIFGAHAGYFVAKHGVERDMLPWDVLLEAHVSRDRPLIVLDARSDVRFAANPIVADRSVQFFVGVPLVSSEHVQLGVLSVLDHAPRNGLRDADVTALIQIAQTIMNRVEDASATSDLRQSAPAYSVRPKKQPVRRSYQQQKAIDLDID